MGGVISTPLRTMKRLLAAPSVAYPPLIRMASRITSYNVCYTKLLRTPDGRAVLFASLMESGRTRFNQLYTVSREGGLPTKLPLPYGEFNDFVGEHRSQKSEVRSQNVITSYSIHYTKLYELQRTQGLGVSPSR